MWKQFRDSDYEISTDGQARRASTGRILRQNDDGRGYLKVTLWLNKQQYTFKVHALVAEVYLTREPDCEVNHLDSNRKNNSVDNLEWVPHTANMKHAWESGAMQYGGGSVHAKLDESAVEEIILDMIDGKSNSEIAKFYPVTRGTIAKIRSDSTWRHVRPELRPLPPGPERAVKLDAEQAAAIRELYAEGASMAAIGRLFGVHSGTVNGVVTGKTWK
jgi:transposase